MRDGGYRPAGQAWAYMAQELHAPGGSQFVALARTPEILNAVFRASGGVMPGANVRRSKATGKSTPKLPVGRSSQRKRTARAAK